MTRDFMAEVDYFTRHQLRKIMVRDDPLRPNAIFWLRKFAAWLTTTEQANHRPRLLPRVDAVPLVLWFASEEDRKNFVECVGSECDTRVLKCGPRAMPVE